MVALELMFYLTIFVAAIFAFDVIMEFASALHSARSLAANRRARLLAEGVTSMEALRKLTGGRSRVAQGERKPDPLADMMLRLEDLLRQSGVGWSFWRLCQIVAIVAVVIAVGALVGLKISIASALFLGAVASVVLALLYLANRAAARKAKMAEQLPDVVDTIVRSLQAGHPIRAALSTVANNAPDPLGTEFGIAVDEMTFGLEMEEALDNLRKRANVPDLDYMVVAITIHGRTGGNLGEILSNLSGVIRDRHRLFKKVRALSAEGRLAAYVIAAVPFVIGIILGLNVPNYYSDAARHASFPMIVTVALALYFGAIFAIWKIVKIRV